jgi:hypothetical protein
MLDLNFTDDVYGSNYKRVFTNSAGSWVTWQKPRGIALINFLVVGGGAGGGGGFTGAAAAALRCQDS